MITKLIVIGVFVGLLIWTSIAQKHGQPTVSMVLRDWAWRMNCVGFLAGFLIGHWFFPRQNVNIWGSGYGLIPLGLIAIYDLIWNWHTNELRTWFRWPGWSVLLGIFLGIQLWAQRSLNSPIY